MRVPVRERIVLIAVVIALAAVLVSLAVLQYRWSEEVSAATRSRMQANLQLSMIAFRQDLYRELNAICSVFQTTSEMGSAKSAERFEEWSRNATHPRLVANVFIWEGTGGSQSQLWHLDPAKHRLERAQWPDRFARLRDRLGAIAADVAFAAGHEDSAEELQERRRFDAVEGPTPGDLLRPRPPVFDWNVDQTIPALFHPVIHRGGGKSSRSAAPTVDWIVIELSRDVLRSTIFPELAQRHFGGNEGGVSYQVAVVGGTGDVIYSSTAGFGQDEAVDASINIFGPPIGRQPQLTPAPRAGTGRRQTSAMRWAFPEPRSPGFAGPLRFEAIHYSREDPNWQLIVRHPKGSLEAAVTALHRRNLMVSFGVLLVLGATVGMIIVVSQRAHRLARLQMDFVATVSHELRTPLAVISSAADNIADGVVDNKAQVVRYGAAIRRQARQLSELVEQILMFAAAGENRQQFNMRALQVSDLVDAALGNTSELLQAAGFTVEKSVEPNLPVVMGDPAALSQVLQNLITNAIKYGSQGRWIGIRAGLASGRREVQVSVEDRGFGISSAEVPHVFEPFYRSPAAAAAQIHGTGLGLALAKTIAEAMGGRLTVASEAGRGSSFTLHLPCGAGQPAEDERATAPTPTKVASS